MLGSKPSNYPYQDFGPTASGVVNASDAVREWGTKSMQVYAQNSANVQGMDAGQTKAVVGPLTQRNVPQGISAENGSNVASGSSIPNGNQDDIEEGEIVEDATPHTHQWHTNVEVSQNASPLKRKRSESVVVELDAQSNLSVPPRAGRKRHKPAFSPVLSDTEKVVDLHEPTALTSMPLNDALQTAETISAISNPPPLPVVPESQLSDELPVKNLWQSKGKWKATVPQDEWNSSLPLPYFVQSPSATPHTTVDQKRQVRVRVKPGNALQVLSEPGSSGTTVDANGIPTTDPAPPVDVPRKRKERKDKGKPRVRPAETANVVSNPGAVHADNEGTAPEAPSSPKRPRGRPRKKALVVHDLTEVIDTAPPPRPPKPDFSRYTVAWQFRYPVATPSTTPKTQEAPRIAPRIWAGFQRELFASIPAFGLSEQQHNGGVIRTNLETPVVIMHSAASVMVPVKGLEEEAVFDLILSRTLVEETTHTRLWKVGNLAHPIELTDYEGYDPSKLESKPPVVQAMEASDAVNNAAVGDSHSDRSQSCQASSKPRRWPPKAFGTRKKKPAPKYVPKGDPGVERVIKRRNRQKHVMPEGHVPRRSTRRTTGDEPDGTARASNADTDFGSEQSRSMEPALSAEGILKVKEEQNEDNYLANLATPNPPALTPFHGSLIDLTGSPLTPLPPSCRTLSPVPGPTSMDTMSMSPLTVASPSLSPSRKPALRPVSPLHSLTATSSTLADRKDPPAEADQPSTAPDAVAAKEKEKKKRNRQKWVGPPTRASKRIKLATEEGGGDVVVKEEEVDQGLPQEGEVGVRPASRAPSTRENIQEQEHIEAGSSDQPANDATAPPPPLETLPKEVRVLLDAFIEDSPISILATREKILEFLPNATENTLSTSFAYAYLGFFKILGLEERPLCVVPPNANLVHSPTMAWTFRVQWVKGGEEILHGKSDTELSRPWWLPAPVAESSEENTELCSGTKVDQDKYSLAQIETPALYKLAKEFHPNHAIRDIPRWDTHFSLVPQFLLAELDSSVPDDAIPTGWLCRECGRINFQESMRRRKCHGPDCQAKGKSYRHNLNDLRGPYGASPICLPFNEYPKGDVKAIQTTWKNGMKTLSYYFDGDQRRTFAKHVFTSNIKQFQKAATDLLAEVQIEVDLKRQVTPINGSPYFTCTYNIPESSPAISGVVANQASTQKTPPVVVPECISKARNLLLTRTKFYAEIADEVAKVSRADVMGWITAGSRKNHDVLRAKQGPVMVLCLGCDVVMTLAPVQDKVKVKKVAAGVGTAKVKKPRKGKTQVEVPADDTTNISAANEPPPLPSASTVMVKAEEVPASVPADPTVVSRNVQITLVHGDVVILSGDDFEYSLKRSGTSILIFGSS